MPRFALASVAALVLLASGCQGVDSPGVPSDVTPRDPDRNPDGPMPAPMDPAPGGGGVVAPPNDTPVPGEDPAAPADPAPAELVARVRDLSGRADVTPMPAAPAVPAPMLALGQALAFDKVLSGNGDVSCMTCHHPALATADARSLSVGVDGSGLGMARVHPDGARIPRNAPALFNLHAQPAVFWDNRVRSAPGGALETPADDALTPAMRAALTYGPAAAQAMFPVTSREEMRGQAGENELAAVSDDNPAAIWDALMDRLGGYPEYVSMFESAYPGQSFDDMSFAHAANAIAAFEIASYDATDTPWDRFLRGDDDAMSEAELRGADFFFGAGRCGTCHSGASLSDFRAHNTAVPQVGPGIGDGAGGNDDFGFEHVSGDPRTRYAFRTSPLRNVELTAPYGHDGAYVTLGAVLSHYRDPRRELAAYDPNVLEPVLRDTMVDNHAAILANLDPLMQPVPMGPQQMADLRAFMGALTDDASRDLLATIPDRVPSGLPVAD